MPLIVYVPKPQGPFRRLASRHLRRPSRRTDGGLTWAPRRAMHIQKSIYQWVDKKGNILTGNHRFSNDVWDFPVVFPF